MTYRHIPVMLDEVIKYLDPKPGNNYIDCTLGGGGYTFAIREKIGDKGEIISIDLDPLSINNANKIIKEKKIKNIKIAHDNFKNLSKIVQRHNFNGEATQASISKEKKRSVFRESDYYNRFDGIVFDLGLSGAQLEDRSRGFSFQEDAVIDMSFGNNSENTISTYEILNKWNKKDIEKILREYGEEKFSYRIAENIVKSRKILPIKTTFDLIKIIKISVPPFYRRQKIHYATRVFQALRIATNDELNNLITALPQAVNLLKKEGKIIVISYHSLEDRIVKNYLRNESKNCLCNSEILVCQCKHKASIKIITKKPLVPSLEEISNNPRSRSAKMRIAEKI